MHYPILFQINMYVMIFSDDVVVLYGNTSNARFNAPHSQVIRIYKHEQLTPFFAACLMEE